MAVKASVFAQVLFLTFSALQVDWNMLLPALALATMTIGDEETNLKRMLISSTISPTGYPLMAGWALTRRG